jgi:hypothetical protein
MIDLLTAFKAKRAEIGARNLANQLGISPSAVRMVCTGHYANPENVLINFASKFVNPYCPFTDAPITRTECDLHALRNRPSGGRTLQSWWDTCQTCTYKGKRSC